MPSVPSSGFADEPPDGIAEPSLRRNFPEISDMPEPIGPVTALNMLAPHHVLPEAVVCTSCAPGGASGGTHCAGDPGALRLRVPSLGDDCPPDAGGPEG